MGKREPKPPKHLAEFEYAGEHRSGWPDEVINLAVTLGAARHLASCYDDNVPYAGARKRAKRERQVYRLLRAEDVQPALLAQEVHILWPDDGVWYGAVIEKVGGQRSTSCSGCRGSGWVHARARWHRRHTAARCRCTLRASHAARAPRIAQLDIPGMSAHVRYPETDEEETIDIRELIGERCIAVSEQRPQR